MKNSSIEFIKEEVSLPIRLRNLIIYLPCYLFFIYYIVNKFENYSLIDLLIALSILSLFIFFLPILKEYRFLETYIFFFKADQKLLRIGKYKGIKKIYKTLPIDKVEIHLKSWLEGRTTLNFDLAINYEGKSYLLSTHYLWQKQDLKTIFLHIKRIQNQALSWEEEQKLTSLNDLLGISLVQTINEIKELKNLAK